MQDHSAGKKDYQSAVLLCNITHLRQRKNRSAFNDKLEQRSNKGGPVYIFATEMYQ